MINKASSRCRAGVVALVFSCFGVVANAATPEKNYLQFCATCHGRDGRAVMPGAPSLYANNALFTRPEMELFNRMKTGWDKHPPFFGLIPERDLLELIRYIRTIH